MSCCCLCPLILSLKTWRRGANLHLTIIFNPSLRNRTCSCIAHEAHMWSLIGVEKAPDSDNLLLHAHRVMCCCMLAE